MSELDQALEAYLQNEGEQERYYDLVLKSDFYIPVKVEEGSPATDAMQPLVLESEGKHYMPLFDSAERLTAWAQQEVPYVILAGFGVAAISTPHLHWAVNLGSGFAKEFLPEEIGWLKERAGR